MLQKISTLQGVLLIVNIILPSAILSVPSIAVQYASQDAWISVLLATILGIPVIWLIGYMGRCLGELSLFDWLEQYCWRIVRFSFGLLLTYYYGTAFCVILREFINFIRENVLTSTPAYILLSVTVLVVTYAASQGLLTIVRVNLIIFSFSIMSYALLIFLVIHISRFSSLLPVLETPVYRIMQGSLFPLSRLSEGAILLLFFPFLAQPSRSIKVGMLGLTVAGGLLTSIVLLSIVVLGPNLTPLLVYSSFTVIGVIKIGSLLERVDLFFVSFWICAMYTKLSIYMFATCHCFCKTFLIRDSKPFLIVIGMISFLIALTGWRKEFDLNYFGHYGSLPHLLIFNVVIPIGLGLFWGLKKVLSKTSFQK